MALRDRKDAISIIRRHSTSIWAQGRRPQEANVPFGTALRQQPTNHPVGAMPARPGLVTVDRGSIEQALMESSTQIAEKDGTGWIVYSGIMLVIAGLLNLVDACSRPVDQREGVPGEG
jgi:hypothetical protein